MYGARSVVDNARIPALSESVEFAFSHCIMEFTWDFFLCFDSDEANNARAALSSSSLGANETNETTGIFARDILSSKGSNARNVVYSAA